MLVDAEIAKLDLKEGPSKALASTCRHARALNGRLDSRGAVKAEFWHRPAKEPFAPLSPDVNKQARPGAHLKPCVSALMDRFYAVFIETLYVSIGETQQHTWFSAAPLALLTGVIRGDRPIRLGAPARVPQHRTGSTALPLRSFLSNVNYHFGGQL
ncbi:MAG: hypothetical protein ACP5E2_02435 [Terracidiphilus sp.]